MNQIGSRSRGLGFEAKMERTSLEIEKGNKSNHELQKMSKP
jgi:hypothetical protein